jgi:hypothetical protein
VLEAAVDDPVRDRFVEPEALLAKGNPPVGRKPAPTSQPVPATAGPLPPAQRPAGRGTDRRPDRLRAALRKLPGSFSTAMAARAAGLNSDKVLARLQDLERRGEVQRVGKRWSNQAPQNDVAAAIDRLQARTSNLRIVRERARQLTSRRRASAGLRSPRLSAASGREGSACSRVDRSRRVCRVVR